MANEQNLKHKLTVSEQRAGGRASGRKRKQQKTVQELLNKYLANSVGSNDTLTKLAEKAGITEKQTIKELVTAVCIINTLRKGDVDKLIRLEELLGERQNKASGEDAIIDKLNEVFGNVEC